MIGAEIPAADLIGQQRKRCITPGGRETDHSGQRIRTIEHAVWTAKYFCLMDGGTADIGELYRSSDVVHRNSIEQDFGGIADAVRSYATATDKDWVVPPACTVCVTSSPGMNRSPSWMSRVPRYSSGFKTVTTAPNCACGVGAPVDVTVICSERVAMGRTTSTIGS